MKPTKPDARTLIGIDPVSTAVVKATGYRKIPCKDVYATLKPVIEKHGQVKVDAAIKELFDYEQHGSVLYALLKPSLHVHARMLLGPMPSEWNTWYRNADGSERKGKPKDWPPKLPGPPELTKEELMLRDVPLRMLAERLHEARRTLRSNGKSSYLGKEAAKEVALIEAEYARRNLVLPETPDVVPFTPKRTRKKGGV